MLMVIFGAGASYDSCSSFRPPRSSSQTQRDYWYRPPLAHELFLPLDRYRDISENYRACQYLIPDLEGEVNVEETLDRLRVEAESDPLRARQLLALQYYLRDVTLLCQGEWREHTRGVSNHQKLLDSARRWPNVCLVTFNYDKLVEDALDGLGVEVSAMESYVTHPQFKLIKLHGSVDWVNLVPSVQSGWGTPPPEVLVEAAPRLEETSIFAVERHQPPAEFRKLLLQPYVELPALGIPTNSRSRFVCPPSHVDALRRCIPAVTRILIIGWRATQHHFLKMLAEGLRPETQGLAVCGNEQEAAGTLRNLAAAGMPGDYRPDPGGFSDFVRSPRMAEFLKDPVPA